VHGTITNGGVLLLIHESLGHLRDVGNGNFIYFMLRGRLTQETFGVGSSMRLGRLKNDVASQYLGPFSFNLGSCIHSPALAMGSDPNNT
jgi:hypothetical protein